MTRTPKKDFAPIGALIESSAPLELDYHEQQHLALQMTNTFSELDGVPGLLPHIHELQLGRIAALNPEGEKGPSNLMSLAFSSVGSDLRNATLRIQSDLQPESTIQLSPSVNIWQVWRPGDTEPSHFLENRDLVSMLSRRLAKPEAVAPLMDKAMMSPFEIAHSLGNFLKSEARRFKVRSVYLSSLGSQGAKAVFDVTTMPGKSIKQLSAIAPYRIGQSTIFKMYEYKATYNRFGRVSGGGVVQVSSSDGIAPNQIEAYAHNDQSDNFPIDTLHLALESIRKTYGLYDSRSQQAAA